MFSLVICTHVHILLLLPIHLPCHLSRPSAQLFRSIHLTQQLLLQNEFPLFILLGTLIRAVVLPSYNLFALSAEDVAHDVSAGRHVAFAGFAGLDVYYAVEEVGFAVLAAEVPTDDLVVVGEVGFAVFAAVDAFGGEVDVVGEAHGLGGVVARRDRALECSEEQDRKWFEMLICGGASRRWSWDVRCWRCLRLFLLVTACFRVRLFV